mmetsp:Transcript_15565/g.28558  ORF Transcript_15565/g.28558 Transcript_15565/m.28558 type:complete len:193 (+) Transcript_15565:521-1099(+)|eukprot:CAMPEP_0184528144 /NCGR_PEP_ID=MMETSP0198_2-20121128/11629_1 /TAXON_ID=1112570 /ORGANISM="Thraustochytrium sp., Strain LLF1b" /LENGTH=192 /DNA_ID=CAMNT_0026919959 /DNA_START=444 /DNA_END=1022 /DNA_ORIENTATION=+
MAEFVSKAKLAPPFRFTVVCCAAETKSEDESVYRGAYPSLRNFSFLRGLRLATIVSVVKGGKDSITTDLREFCEYEGIKHFVVDIQDNSAPSSSAAKQVLLYLANKEHLPAYIHCKDGGVVTGTLVMCIRVLQHWSLDSAIIEHCRYIKDGSAGPEKNTVAGLEVDAIEKALSEKDSSNIPSWLCSSSSTTR